MLIKGIGKVSNAPPKPPGVDGREVCHDPKMDVMALILSHQDKSTANPIVPIKCRRKIHNKNLTIDCHNPRLKPRRDMVNGNLEGNPNKHLSISFLHP